VITVKEEFVGCDKWVRAIELGGSDAIVMWLALKRYAAQHLTGGFVPEEEIAKLPGAPRRPAKALDALLRCGRLNPNGERGDGLVHRSEFGWQLHDYEDHANSATEEELRKERARDRKRRQREDKAKELAALKGSKPPRDMSQGQNGTSVPPSERDNGAGHVPGTERDTSQGPHAQTGARPPEPAPQRDPSPTQPNPTQEQETAAATVAAFPMYPLWEPSTETLTGLEIAGVAPWSFQELIGRFKVHFLGDQTDKSTSAVWNQRCAKWVIGDWRIPSKRPQKPDPSTAGDLGEYGASAEWG
jgi:hypothetical protein